MSRSPSLSDVNTIVLPSGRQRALGGVDAEVREPLECRCRRGSRCRCRTGRAPRRSPSTDRASADTPCRPRASRRRRSSCRRRRSSRRSSCRCRSRRACTSAPVDVHDVLLVARPAVARRLEDQPLAVAAEVRLGVLAAVRELPDVRRGAARRSARGRLAASPRRRTRAARAMCTRRTAATKSRRGR